MKNRETYPRSRISPKLKMAHRARVTKTRKWGRSRFVSSRMKKIDKEIRKRSSIMRTIDATNQAFALQQTGRDVHKIGNGVRPKTFMAKNADKSTHPPFMANRDLTSKVSTNSKYSRIVKYKDATLSPTSNGSLKPLELFRKVKTVKTKLGPIHGSNCIKRSYSQANDLKAMPGLIHNTKNRSNLDPEATKGIQIESGLNVVRGMKDNNSMCEPLPGPRISLDTHLNLPRKRRKYIDTNDDIDDTCGHWSDEKDSTSVPLDHATLKDSNAKVSMPCVSKCVTQKHDCCSKPIDESAWSGILKIGSKEYISLAGHLSMKSGEKVWNLSRLLRRMVEATKVCRSKVWPKRWEASGPTSDNIGLYFFPYKMRPDKYYDQLVNEITENDLALRTAIDEVELLIFPSSLLPEQYQMFQSKHYLWGVFGPKVVETKHGDESQHVDNTREQATNATSSVPIDATVVATSVGAVPTKAHTGPTNEGRIDLSMGALPGRVVSFVVRQTPRVEQLIQEMERDGALIFAMQGEMLSGDGSLHRRYGDRNAASRSIP